jgi:hypothetical protein
MECPVLARYFSHPPGDMLRTNIKKYLHQLEEIQPHEVLPYNQRISQEQGLNHWDIRSIDDPPELPILTRDVIRQYFNEILADSCARWQPSLNEWEDATEAIVSNVLGSLHMDSPARTSSDTA